MPRTDQEVSCCSLVSVDSCDGRRKTCSVLDLGACGPTTTLFLFFIF